MQTRSALVGLIPIASAFGPGNTSPNTVTPCFSCPLVCKCSQPCLLQETKEARSNDQSRGRQFCSHYPSPPGRSSRLISIFKRLCACAAASQSQRRTRLHVFSENLIRQPASCRYVYPDVVEKSQTSRPPAGCGPAHSIHLDFATRRLTQCLADLGWHSARSAW